MFLLVPAHPGSPGQRALKRLLLLLLLLLLLFEVLHDVSKQVSCYLKQTATRDILKELLSSMNSYFSKGSCESGSPVVVPTAEHTDVKNY